MDKFFYRCIQLADLLHTEPTNIDYGAWRGMPVTVTAPRERGRARCERRVK